MSNRVGRASLETVVLIGLRQPNHSASQFNDLMNELHRLVETAGGRVVKSFFQSRTHPVPATLIGKGKLEELARAISGTGIKTVVFNDDLTAAQQKNIEKILNAKIVDRTRLILDIFAQRARSREGQLQVELAQLNYLVPRLTGSWRGFSQQVGGIGTRGPGERKIEVERRYVRERIKRLKKGIEEIRDHRSRARSSRQRVPLPQITLVGYTNAGKSTLLNALASEHGQIYSDDKLFATLDPTTRRVKLPSGRTVLFTDTVGFIQKLPSQLIAAFHATLEELSKANLLIHVTDATAENRLDQVQTVNEEIKSIAADSIPRITLINKSDLLSPLKKESLRRNGSPLISAKTGEGLREFLKQVEEHVQSRLLDVTFELPHSKRDLLALIYRTGHIISEHPSAFGTSLRLRIDPANWKYLVYRLNEVSTPS